MTSPFGPLVLVANPRAGRGRVRLRLPAIEEALRREDLEYQVHLTERPGHASELANQAVSSGCRFLVAAGGDGTVNEVLNGMLLADGPGDHRPVLGVVSAGSGCDLIRTLGLPGDAAVAVTRLAGSATRPLDVGRIIYAAPDGQETVRHFANIAEAGLGGSTARRAASVPAALGPARYFVAFWLVVPGYRPGSARIWVDDHLAYEGRAVNVVLANCRYFGGGMHISPKSEPDDGSLDVLVFNGPKSDSFTTLPKVYAGRHLRHRNVVELKGRRLRIEAEHPLAIEADGEVLGTTPASVEVLPRLIDVKV